MQSKKNISLIFEPSSEISETIQLEFAPVERPEVVRVLGRNYDIEYVKKVVKKDDVLGVTLNNDLKIKIKENQLLAEEQDTVLHEVLHAIDHTLFLKLSEKQVRVVATALLGVFKDNPVFANYIFYNEDIPQGE